MNGIFGYIAREVLRVAPSIAAPAWPPTIKELPSSLRVPAGMVPPGAFIYSDTLSNLSEGVSNLDSKTELKENSPTWLNMIASKDDSNTS